LFVNLILLHFIEYKSNKKLSFLPALLLAFISIWAVGRAGIIAAIIYLLYLVFYSFNKRDKLFKFLLTFTFIILIYFYYTRYIYDGEFIYKNYFYRLTDDGINYSDDERKTMLVRYIDNINLATLIVGYNYYNDAYFLTWDRNPHNSFIHLHSLYGFMFFPFVFFLLKRLISHIKENSFFFIALLLLLFRAWIDTFFFFGIYDFLIFLFLLYNFKSKYINLKYDNN
jgi:hypothetical protein